jgi:UDP-N-acetylmuramate dehydrogenase
MKISRNINLAEYTTMRVGGNANYLTEVSTLDELIESMQWAKDNKIKFFVMGGGSNTIFTDTGYSGLVIINKIKLKNKFEIINSSNDYLIKSGAGEKWDDLVAFSVDNGLTGVEALSSIPGRVGAAPVQNIGAYGQQVGDVINELEAISIESLQLVRFGADDCNFSYRSSRFNSSDKGKYIIISVQLKLKKANYIGKIYKDVEDYFNFKNYSEYDNLTPAQIREAVISIRSNKLPDPKLVANAGSFFKNPIISEDEFSELKLNNPSVMETPPGWNQNPFWKVEGGYKISAGWLVGKAGFSSFYDDDLDFGTWPKQKLVLYSNSTEPRYQNLKSFRDLIKFRVQDYFNIALQQEPEEVVE